MENIKKKSNNLGNSNAEKHISLKPYKFDEAVSDLLKVKPKLKEKKSNTNKNRSEDK